MQRNLLQRLRRRLCQLPTPAVKPSREGAFFFLSAKIGLTALALGVLREVEVDWIVTQLLRGFPEEPK